MYKYGISHFQDLTELVVHVVGAGAYELPASCVWEEITHLLPNIQKLTVEFIGPEVCLMIKSGEYPTKPMDEVCLNALSKGGNSFTGCMATLITTLQQNTTAHPTLLLHLILECMKSIRKVGRLV